VCPERRQRNPVGESPTMKGARSMKLRRRAKGKPERGAS
jgi:hypothetical protein